MRTALVMLGIATLAFGSVRAESPPWKPTPANRVVLRFARGKKGYMLIGSQIIGTTEELKEVVRKMPRGFELFWSTGDVIYYEIPLKGALLPLEELKAFCAENGVTFTHQTWGF